MIKPYKQIELYPERIKMEYILYGRRIYVANFRQFLFENIRQVGLDGSVFHFTGAFNANYR